MDLGAAGGDEDELGAPRGLAVAFEVESRVGFGPPGRISPVVAVDAVSPGWALNSGVMTLPSAWSMPGQVEGGSTSRARRGRARPSWRACAAASSRCDVGERGEDAGSVR